MKNDEGDIYHFFSNTDKICFIRVIFGEMKNYSIYPIKEYNDISPQTQYSIIVSSKIEEDYHYIIYNNYNYKMYYDDIENGIIS